MKPRSQWAVAALTLTLACAPAALAATSGQSKPAQQSQATHAKATQSAKSDAGYRNWTATQMKNLQKALAAKGFSVEAGGHWNDATRAAIKTFQRKNGLRPTGFPNTKTRKALGLDW